MSATSGVAVSGLAPQPFDRLNHFSKEMYSLSRGRHANAQLSAFDFVITSADSEDHASIAHPIDVRRLTRHLESASVQDAVQQCAQPNAMRDGRDARNRGWTQSIRQLSQLLCCLNFGPTIAKCLSQLFSWAFGETRGKNRGKTPSSFTRRHNPPEHWF
jgi:hypothetical protein